MSRSFLSARSSLSCCSNANRSPRGISKKMSWMSYRAARNWGTTEAHMNTGKDGPLLSVDSNCTFIPGLWLSPAGSGLVLSRWPSSVELQSGRIGWTPVYPKQTYTHTFPNMQLFHTHFFCVCLCESVISPQWSGADVWPSLFWAACVWGSREWWRRFDRTLSVDLLSEPGMKLGIWMRGLRNKGPLFYKHTLGHTHTPSCLLAYAPDSASLWVC